jgi:ABC-type multidrug transport system permease subunit
MTSKGDPTLVTSAKDLATAAVYGILMIIFSIFILRIIGINILGLF